VTVYKVKRKTGPSWMIDFEYIDPATGHKKRHRRVAKGVKTKREAMALELKLRDELRAPPPPPTTTRKDAPFGDYAGHWLTTRRPDWAPSTVKGYERDLRVHLVPWFRRQTLRAITVEGIQRYKAEKLERGWTARNRGRDRSGLRPKTVNNHLAVLSALFQDAVRWGYADRNPVKDVRPCRDDRTAQDFAFWTREQSERFIAAIQEVRPRWYPFFLCALRTGMRLGELAALRWGDVDFERRRVNVRRAFSDGRETRPKGGRARTVPMSPQLCQALREHHGSAGDQVRVFLSDQGKTLNTNRVKHPLWRGIEAAGLEKIRIHDLRHSFASQLAIAGVSLYKIQALLGHQDISMTMRYAHLSPETQDEAVLVLDGAA